VEEDGLRLTKGLGDRPTMVWPGAGRQTLADSGCSSSDYPLEYYEDGYPKLPACLDRRPVKLAEAA
jgi:hypothetical protein